MQLRQPWSVGKDAIVQLRSDPNVVIGGLGQLTTDVLPAVSSSLNLDDARFKELLRTRYPAISAGIAGGGSATAALEKTVANLEARREDFRDVDSLPVAGMPLQATTALMMALGGALFLGGLLAWRPGGPAPLVAITALAALAMLGTVVTRSPQKAAAGERVLGSLNITNATAQRTRAQFDGAAAFLAEFQTRLLPDTQLTTSISQPWNGDL